MQSSFLVELLFTAKKHVVVGVQQNTSSTHPPQNRSKDSFLLKHFMHVYIKLQVYFLFTPPLLNQILQQIGYNRERKEGRRG